MFFFPVVFCFVVVSFSADALYKFMVGRKFRIFPLTIHPSTAVSLFVPNYNILPHFPLIGREDSLITPSWMWEVVYRAPLLYLDFYFTSKAMQLPPRRQACLLRAAIETANTELAVLKDRIHAHEVRSRLLCAVSVLCNWLWGYYRYTLLAT